MSKLIIPKDYKSYLSVLETEQAIKHIKDHFQAELVNKLNLKRVSAPLFVLPETGLNDNLNGVERPVSFEVKGIGNNRVEVVHSLAKWKRMALKKYDFNHGEGLYTDMNAIRRDEDLDNLHSIYVDQWDWEKIISQGERNETTLKGIVEDIYAALKDTERFVCESYPQIPKILPDKITYITTQELLDKYPDKTPKERENAIAKECGAVFLMKIGGRLSNGEPHDGRAPDYDDWELNGDILLWYPVLEQAFEISSMGIRVDEKALLSQLKEARCEDRIKLKFHTDLLNGHLPYTVGGGIGQSRLCMFLLMKAHIGEVQSSIWDQKMICDCAMNHIELL